MAEVINTDKVQEYKASVKNQEELEWLIQHLRFFWAEARARNEQLSVHILRYRMTS